MFDFVLQDKEDLIRFRAGDAAEIAKLKMEKDELKRLQAIDAAEIAKLKVEHEVDISCNQFCFVLIFH